MMDDIKTEYETEYKIEGIAFSFAGCVDITKMNMNLTKLLETL
jgi:hypothetical protein